MQIGIQGKALVAVQALAFALSSVALADGDRDVIFDKSVSAGATYSSTAQTKVSPALNIRGLLLIGDQDKNNVHLDLGLVSAVRDGGAEWTEADIALKGRYMLGNHFGFELSALPLRYRQDDGYLELSGVEVSAVVQVIDGKNHKVTIKGGVNPFTKRWYKDDLGATNTKFDSVMADARDFDAPSAARVDGIQTNEQYRHDPRADGTENDNSRVVFEGGGLKKSVDTTYDKSENSVRIPLSIEYKFTSGNKKLTINAVAYYSLRIAQDKFIQNDKITNEYDGTVTYSNVTWEKCTDAAGLQYDCNPTTRQFSGHGQIEEVSHTSTDLKGGWSLAHNVGGKLIVDYSVFKNDVIEILLDGRVKAEFDSHLLNGGPDYVGSSIRVDALGGAIVRF